MAGTCEEEDVPSPCERPKESDVAVVLVVEAGEAGADAMEPRRLFLPPSWMDIPVLSGGTGMVCALKGEVEGRGGRQCICSSLEYSGVLPVGNSGSSLGKV